MTLGANPRSIEPSLRSARGLQLFHMQTRGYVTSRRTMGGTLWKTLFDVAFFTHDRVLIVLKRQEYWSVWKESLEGIDR